MGESTDIAHGITISFGTSGFSANLTDITPPAAERESIDTSHQGTTSFKTFTPADLAEWGSLEVTIHFNPATDPPIDQAAETVTITWPDSDTWAFTGFMTNYAGDAPHNGLMTGTATVKVSGDVTISSASASGSGA